MAEEKHRRQQEFLEKLHALIQEYDVEFEYTIDDDGIHISVGGDECFVGWLYSDASDLAAVLGHNT